MLWPNPSPVQLKVHMGAPYTALYAPCIDMHEAFKFFPTFVTLEKRAQISKVAGNISKLHHDAWKLAAGLITM